MNYLDAAIAFAILMAVLAGLVTTLMQGIWRILRVKQGNLITVLKKLDAEVLQGSSLELNADQRWDTIVSILNNPTSARPALPHAEQIMTDGKLPRRWRPWSSSLAADADETPCLETAISCLDRSHANSSQYDRATAEHVARRLTEVVGDKATKAGHERFSEQLNLVVRKFEEYASAMSAEFTRRSFFWSISVGILLAVIFNINGLVAFNTFLAEPDLARQISVSENTLSAQTKTPEGVEGPLENLDSTLRELSAKGIPIGPTNWPHCKFKGPDACDPPIEFESYDIWMLIFVWLPSAIVTGIFIGLGAPFWFDAAKRLSAIRSMFGGVGKTADRLSGRSADGNPKARAEIVASVLNDQLEGEPMIKRHTFDGVSDLSRLAVTVNDNSDNTHFMLTVLGGDRSQTEYVNEEVRAGVAHPLEAAAGFHRADLEVIFRGNDQASIEIAVPGSNSNPWKFQLTGEKGQLCRAICAVFMA